MVRGVFAVSGGGRRLLHKRFKFLIICLRSNNDLWSFFCTGKGWMSSERGKSDYAQDAHHNNATDNKGKHFPHSLCPPFLIANCSLIRESCSAKASGFTSVSILDPSNRLTGTSKISASFINRSESGTERPFSHFETVCLTTFNRAASSYCVIHFSLRSAFRLS